MLFHWRVWWLPKSDIERHKCVDSPLSTNERLLNELMENDFIRSDWLEIFYALCVYICVYCICSFSTFGPHMVCWGRWWSLVDLLPQLYLLLLLDDAGGGDVRPSISALSHALHYILYIHMSYSFSLLLLRENLHFCASHIATRWTCVRQYVCQASW